MMSLRRALWIGAAAVLAGPASAFDGGMAVAEPGPTYYEVAVDEETVASAETTRDGAASGGLPSSLYVVDGAGGVTYRPLGDGAWEVSVEVAERPHERVDAVYDLVLALPLPLGSKARAWRIVPTASPGSTSGIVYGGEPVVLKRNVPLEHAWLPMLAGAPGGLPDLAGTGYAWTFWDAIVRYDANAGTRVRAHGTFRYETDPGIAALDASDPENAAYVITWIPTVESVPPFAVRLDVVDASEE
jgi:hypothetical protein